MVNCNTLLLNPPLNKVTVEADYTVVFFAAGNQYTPGWNWIWKAYRSLSRKYRKNLKQLVSPFSLPSRPWP
jgi:Divergent CRAL/TRIO domain